jgi:hypothetical protein
VSHHVSKSPSRGFSKIVVKTRFSGEGFAFKNCRACARIYRRHCVISAVLKSRFRPDMFCFRQKETIQRRMDTSFSPYFLLSTTLNSVLSYYRSKHKSIIIRYKPRQLSFSRASKCTLLDNLHLKSHLH